MQREREREARSVRPRLLSSDGFTTLVNKGGGSQIYLTE